MLFCITYEVWAGSRWVKDFLLLDGTQDEAVQEMTEMEKLYKHFRNINVWKGWS